MHPVCVVGYRLLQSNILKVLNYARLYGSGVSHAAEFLMQSAMNPKKALSISNKLFSTTKGKRFK